MKSYLAPVFAGLSLCISIATFAYTETITYVYDDLNRLSEAKSASGLTQRFNYDDKHNRTDFVRINRPTGAPIAVDDNVSTGAGQALVFTTADLLANDIGNGTNALQIANYFAPRHGSFSVDVNNEITYTPNAGFVGEDVFYYQVTAGTLLSNIAKVVILVTDGAGGGGFIPLLANDDTFTLSQAPNQVLNVLANDQYTQGASVSDIVYNGTGNVIIENNAIVYTPAENYKGTDTLRYTISAQGRVSSATVTIEVNGENSAPIARSDYVLAIAGQTITIPVLANDSDLDGDSLTLMSINYTGTGTVSIENNYLVYSNNGQEQEQFTYQVSDGIESVTGFVFINARGNLAPIARNDSYTVMEDTSQIMLVLSNDEDPEGEPLTIVSRTNPAHGSLSLVNAGKFIYTPNRNFVGNDSFNYTIRDPLGKTATAKVNIKVERNQNNLPPIAVNDYLWTQPNQSKTINVLANDSDPENEGLRMIAFTQPNKGSVTKINNSVLRYTPPTGFLGETTFSYTIEDAGGVRRSATVRVSVRSVGTIMPPIIMFLLDDDCELDTQTGKCKEAGQ